MHSVPLEYAFYHLRCRLALNWLSAMEYFEAIDRACSLRNPELE